MDNRALADAVAIVSIVAGATVAIAVPFINAMLERRRLRWQSETARFDELRALLDAAIVHAYEAWTVVYEWEQVEGQKDPQSAEWSPKRLRALASAMTAKFDEVQRDQFHINVRLPAGAPITEKHLRMRDVLIRCEFQYTRYVEGGGPEQRLKPPVRLPAAGLVPSTDEGTAATEEGRAALSEFMNEVRSFVGATSEARETGQTNDRLHERLLRR
jgi:hypothetical protein